MRAEHDTKPCGQDGPHPLVPAYGSSLSHHVQISFLWLSGTPPPSLPSICSSCQLSNAFESGKDTHTHAYFRSDVRDARLSHSYQHVRKLSDSLVGGKKANTYRAVFTIKAGVVSLQNVALLKILRSLILYVLREFLIGSGLEQNSPDR